MVTSNPQATIWQQLIQKTDEKKVTILRNLSRFPSYKEEFAVPYFVLVYCQQGEAQLSYDNKKMSLVPGSIMIWQPGHILRIEEHTDSYKMSILVLAKDLYDSWRRVSGNLFIRFIQSPTFMATSDQIVHIKDAIRVLENQVSLEYALKDEDLLSLLKIVINMIGLYSQAQTSKPIRKLNHNEEIFMQFYDLLLEHYAEARDIAFYANKLCISPKYFSAIILKATGITAMDWITNYVIMRAQLLLKHHREISIQDVGYQLGFNEQAAFSRYFHRESGMTPSQYRSM